MVLFILLSFLLRIHNLSENGFWSDEGLTALRSSYRVSEILSNRITIQEGVTKDTHPPLYYLILHASRSLLGETDFAFRYPSLLAGILLVPLLYQFGRRLRGASLGYLTAFLTVINPLHVWYANEARMYTMFVLLAAAATYVLWRALSAATLSRRSLMRYAFLYIVVAALAVYTHYTAILLMAAQGIFWALLLWRRGNARLLFAMAVVGFLIAIPVIPFTWKRLFTGAEANYSLVSPIIMLQDVIHAFSLGVTADATLLTTKLLDLGMLALLLAGLLASRNWLIRVFLLVYLYSVVVGLMAGSLIKPMYQGVRHIMVGSPAFSLLVAWGLLWLIERIRFANRRSSMIARFGLAILGMITVLLGPIISLDNLYNDGRYAKNDFRSLIRFVEERAGERDSLLYNNAVLLALHDHYRKRSDVGVAAAPIYPYSAAGSETQLENLAQQYDRLWFVTDPPADGRDSDRFVREWLDTHLYTVVESNFPGRTTEVKVIAYATAARQMRALPPDAEPLSVQWETLPPLRGIEPGFSQPAALPFLWLDLFWQGGEAYSPTTRLRFSLIGPDNDVWQVHEQPMIMYLPTDWPESGLVRQGYNLPLPKAPPPGTYLLSLQPVTAPNDSSAGEARPLAEVELAASSSRPVPPALLSATPSLLFSNGLALQGIEFPAVEVRPGHNLPFTIFWLADTELVSFEGTRYQLEVVGPKGDVLRTQSKSPGAEWLKTWPVHTLIQENASLYFPPETEPGRFHLRWKLLDGDTPIPARPSWRPWEQDSNIVGEIRVEPWPLVTTLPSDLTATQADFGSTIQLYGYKLSEPVDNTVGLTLYWIAQAVPTENYFSFVHLVSSASGEIVSQEGFVPVNGLRPTRGWRPDEVLADSYRLELPPDSTPGEYRLIAGLFVPESGERPPVVYQGELQPENQLTLTTLILP